VFLLKIFYVVSLESSCNQLRPDKGTRCGLYYNITIYTRTDRRIRPEWKPLMIGIPVTSAQFLDFSLVQPCGSEYSFAVSEYSLAVSEYSLAVSEYSLAVSEYSLAALAREPSAVKLSHPGAYSTCSSCETFWCLHFPAPRTRPCTLIFFTFALYHISYTPWIFLGFFWSSYTTDISRWQALNIVDMTCQV